MERRRHQCRCGKGSQAQPGVAQVLNPAGQPFQISPWEPSPAGLWKPLPGGAAFHYVNVIGRLLNEGSLLDTGIHEWLSWGSCPPETHTEPDTTWMIRLQRAEDFQARSRKAAMMPTGNTGREDTAGEGTAGAKAEMGQVGGHIWGKIFSL